MPKLPQFVPQVSPQVGATPGYTAGRVVPMQDAIGVQLRNLGRAAQQAGEGYQRAGDYLQDQIDDAASQTAYNNYAEKLAKLENDYQLLQGGAAIEARPKVLKAQEELRRSFEEPLGNANQQRRFAARADIRSAHSRLAVDEHSAKAAKQFEAGALDAGAKASSRDMARFWQDPQKAALYKGDMIAKVNKLEDMKGSSPEARAEAVLQATTGAHLQVLDSLAQNDAAAASLYLQQNSKEMTPDAVTRTQEVLRHAGVQQRSVQFSFAAVAQAAKRGGTLAEQETYAMSIAAESYRGKKLDEATYAAASDRITKEFAIQRNLQSKLSNDAVIAAEKFFLNPANKDKTLSDLDPKVTKVLTDSGQLDVIQRLADRQKGYDPEMWETVQGLTEEQHRKLGDEEFAAMALRLSPAQRQIAQKLRIAAVGDPVSRAKAAAGVTESMEIAAVGRRVLKDRLAEVTHDKDATNALMDDFQVSVGEQWNNYVQEKKINPNDRAEFTRFLRQEEARMIVARDGKPVSPYAIERATRLDLEANPVVTFQGQPTRVSDLPIQITVTDAAGAAKTLSRAELAADLQLALGTAPTEQQVAAYIESRIRTSSAPVQIQMAPRLRQEQEQRRKEQNERILRMGAGGKR